MAELDLQKLFQPLYSDVEAVNEFYNEKPLLAHYTSIDVIEKILRTETIWFSNPLFMNDYQELRFGLNEGLRLFLDSAELEQAAKTPERYKTLKDAYNWFYDQFAQSHAADTFIFSMCKHDPADDDGKLSMWRGYGSNGNGACIVIDAGKIPVVNGSPLIFAKVYYARADERITHLQTYITQFCSTLKSEFVPDHQLGMAVWYLFERIKKFSLFTKHIGFSEEEEWRIAYFPDLDQEKVLHPMMDYVVGERGIEPKLKYRFGNIPESVSTKVSLHEIIDRIILGPTVSSPLAKAMTERMLDKVDKAMLKPRLKSSSIPFRVNISV